MKKAKSGQGITALVVSVGIVIVGVGLLRYSQMVSAGIKSGLIVCGNILIPALFPFMILANFVSLTEYAKILSYPFRFITTKVFKLAPELGVVVFLSMIGGYPVGAKMIANLLDSKKISTSTAQRMLCFCTNSGPSFLISAVGVGMLFNKTLGVMLFAIQTITTLIIGAVASIGAKEEAITENHTKMSGTVAFVTAVSSACSSMIVMCGFAVLFFGILAVVRESGVIEAISLATTFPALKIDAVVSGLLEVTSGCIGGAKIAGAYGAAFISFCISFCGLSVIFQIISCIEGRGIKFGKFVLSRIIHGVISSGLTFLCYSYLPGAVAVSSGSNRPILYSDTKTWILSICLMSMCSLMVLFPKNKR